MTNNLSVEKRDFIWNFLGLTVNSFSSFFFLIIVNRVNGQYDAGIFTFAYSLMSLFYVVGIFYNRAFQVADVNSKYRNIDYVFGKVLTCSLMILLSFLMVFIFKYNIYKAIIVLLICFFRMMDSFSDTLYGIMQKENQLYKTGISLFLKGLLSVLFFLLIDILTENLILACLSLPILNVIITYFYDWKNTKKYVNKDVNVKKTYSLLKEALPVFLFSFMSLYLVNSSKYTLDFFSTPEIQNVFGIILMPGTVLSLCCQYLLNPYLLNLTSLYKDKEMRKYNSLLFKIIAYIVIFGLACEIGCYFIGIPVLNFLYGFDLSSYKWLLMLVILGAVFMALTSILSASLTVLKENKKQVYIYAIDSVISLILSILLVKKYEITGATLTYSIVMLFQFINYLILHIKITNKVNKEVKL